MTRGPENVAYRTAQLAEYFSRHRVTWDQFYDSERVVIARVRLGPNDNVLDVGCGCGGLGLALREQFGVRSYTGVEISSQAAEVARTLNPAAVIHAGDILDITRTGLRDRVFDVVFSLSCVDWNVRFEDMLAAAWRHVRPGGHLIATFRFTPGAGCNDISRSYQFVNYEGKREGEHASYVVLNANTLFRMIADLGAAEVFAYGYWGAPSPTAVTPYETLCFAALAIRKRDAGESGPLRCELDLPPEIRDTIDIAP